MVCVAALGASPHYFMSFARLCVLSGSLWPVKICENLRQLYPQRYTQALNGFKASGNLGIFYATQHTLAYIG